MKFLHYYRKVVKVKKDRKLKLPAEIVSVFQEYVGEYLITDTLFPFTDRFLRLLIKQVAQRANLSKKVSAQILRDTCAVRALKRGEGIELVLTRLGLSASTWEDAKEKYVKLESGEYEPGNFIPPVIELLHV